MNKIRLEIAVDHAQAAMAAAQGGAERLELCSSLADGGLTPSIGFVEWALAHTSIPLHCMVRPRGGNFVYTPAELDVMLLDIEAMRRAGAHGVVLGVLNAQAAVNVEATTRLVEAAGPMRVCFHRAFDHLRDRKAGLEDVIRTGASILLTSGGASSLLAGATEVQRIVDQAAGRIEIMGGAGVRLKTAGEIWRTVSIDTLHASMRSRWAEAGYPGDQAASMGLRDHESIMTVRADDVRALLQELEPRPLLTA